MIAGHSPHGELLDSHLSDIACLVWTRPRRTKVVMVGDQNIEWNADSVPNAIMVHRDDRDGLQYHCKRKLLFLGLLRACCFVPAVPDRIAEQPAWLHGGEVGMPATRMPSGGQATRGHPTLPSQGTRASGRRYRKPGRCRDGE